MVDLLTKDHFEAIRAQMERKEEGKVTLKTIPHLTDVPLYRSSMTTSKHFRNFKTYLSQRYGVEGFPLDYMVRLMLAATDWSLFALCDQCCPGQGELMPDFFWFKESDYHCR